MSPTPRSLASFVAAVEGGTPPDDALRAVVIRLDSRQTVVPRSCLEPIRRRGCLLRGPAALLCDTAARACVDAQGLGTRQAVFAAHRMRTRRAFQRLGYRSDADYAREQLGITARSFRDLARLGGRLEGLPRIKAAFLRGDLTRAQAEVVAAVATPGDETVWLERARSSTVRGLKAAARQARQKAREGFAEGRGNGAQSADDPDGGEGFAEERGSADSLQGKGVARGDALSTEDERRQRRVFDVPADIVGKIDAVLELAARVAGAPVPAGTLWEFIAAEYLSGAPLAGPGEDRAVGDDPGADDHPPSGDDPAGGHDPGADDHPPSGDDPAVGKDPAADDDDETEVGDGDRPAVGLPRGSPVVTPEDPRGYQRVLERESRDWYFLPTVRPRLELHGDWRHLQPVREEREDAAQRPLTPWELHRELKAALAAENRVAWQLGRLLTTIRNRRLWRTMCFASFSHYVRERLGISPRAAERLVRVDREMWDYPALRRAYHGGKLSPLVADTLVRVLRHIDRDDEVQQTWIDFAGTVTFERLTAVVRAVERLRAVQPCARRHLLCTPAQVEVALASDEAGPPMFVTGTDAADPGSPVFVTSRYVVWMTEDEYGTLAMAMQAARAGAGAMISDAACMNALLDHFLAVYDDANAREMRRRHAVFERDGWRCCAPGCSAYGPLHAHHIVFRGHGGSDDPTNLVTLCDFHHKALHDRWIRCVGCAPDALYWELGVDTRDGPCEAPVERVTGDRRLSDDEYWNGVRVLTAADNRNRVA